MNNNSQPKYSHQGYNNSQMDVLWEVVNGSSHCVPHAYVLVGTPRGFELYLVPKKKEKKKTLNPSISHQH